MIDGGIKGNKVCLFFHVRDIKRITNVGQPRATITAVKTIAERLKESREEAGLTQPALALRAGVSQGTIGNIETGLRKRPRELLSIAAALGVNASWLETGKGEKKPHPRDEVAFIQDGLVGDANLSDLPQFLRKGDVENVKPAQVGTRRIPVISSIQAGVWSEIVDGFQPGDAEDWLVTDIDLSESAFALDICGNSMEPEFRAGDRVIIDPSITPQPGDFVAAKNGEEEATFKKYRPRGIDSAGNVVFELVPLNDDYPTLRSDTQPIKIVGTMVEHRKYRRR